MEKDTSGDHRSSSPDVASDDEMEEEDEPRKPKPRKRRTGAASKRLTKHNKDADPSKAAILDRKQAVPHVQRWYVASLLDLYEIFVHLFLAQRYLWRPRICRQGNVNLLGPNKI